jgi:hypothetical protein
MRYTFRSLGGAEECPLMSVSTVPRRVEGVSRHDAPLIDPMGKREAPETRERARRAPRGAKGVGALKRRVLSMLLALGLVASLFSSVLFTASADNIEDMDLDLTETIFYPFVPNGEMLDGTGPWYGGITVQNLEPKGVRIWAFRDAEFDPDNALGTWLLPPYSSQTISSNQLGLSAPGSPVVITAVFRDLWEAKDEDEFRDRLFDCVYGDVVRGLQFEEYLQCKPKIAGTLKQAAPEPLGGRGTRTSAAHTSVDGHTAIPAQDVAWGPMSQYCDYVWGGIPDICNSEGFYLLPFGGIGFVFDGHSYMPIVQTNSGWNTILHLSNIDPSVENAAIVVELIRTDQQGYAAAGSDKYLFEEIVPAGTTWTLDLRAAGIPDGWVGSAWITSNGGVVANAMRVKVESDMLVTNVSVPSIWVTTTPDDPDGGFGPVGEQADLEFVGPFGFEMYAPLIFRDYNGWNTGISILNVTETWNAITVTFYGPSGNVVGQDRRTISPKSQEFIYIPHTQDLGLGGETGSGWVGSALISSDSGVEFHAVIDQVKYMIGEAMSYAATAAGARAKDSGMWYPDADYLGLPLFQKGSVMTGLGDMSGIQLFNASSKGSITVEITFYFESGALMEPTIDGPIPLTIPALGNATVYSATLTEMGQNASGSAIVRAVKGHGQVVAVSNNVNYALCCDGSVAFNLVNNFGQYRLPVGQTEPPFVAN